MPTEQVTNDDVLKELRMLRDVLKGLDEKKVDENKREVNVAYLRENWNLLTPEEKKILALIGITKDKVVEHGDS